MTPTILRVRTYDALILARAVKAHVSREDITPVICGTGLSVHDGKLQALGTDRYTVVRVRIPHYSRATDKTPAKPVAVKWTLDDETVILPRVALDWIAANAARFRNEYIDLSIKRVGEDKKVRTLITVTVTDEYSDESVQATFTSVRGNYPPVGRLIDGHEPGSVDKLKFNPDFLARTRAGLPRSTAVDLVTGASRNGKPGPMLFRAEIGEQSELVGLIQPNLLLP